jgi:2-polyprenyl-6-methoxyphenol hydroxylase-like FAD-dependent oxidoreductase
VQFHLNGFRPGDPGFTGAARSEAPEIAARALPETADVLIVGCGPAGLTLAAQLSAFPEIHTVIVDQKPGPLTLGQADGIACRTMEMFEAFGFADRVLKESYWVNETTFWKPDPTRPGHISRSGRVPDVEDGLSHMPHVILNQARVHDFYLDIMERSPSRLTPHYSRTLVGLERASEESSSHPVAARFERLRDGHAPQNETVRARYVVGCDGSRSTVRQSIGRALHGDSANQAWGVMDVLAVTDFPDIRFKSLIQSDGEGSIVLIPREGGYLVRLYVELDKLATNERVAARNITIEQLIAAAQRILRPYALAVKEVAWWSVYEIGQRLCDHFDDAPASVALPRIFIAGDACHTHSPKAGQGMNVSMQDAFNLGWKLSSVLRGICPPTLLSTYSSERQAVAAELIEFDRDWAKILSAGVGAEHADVQQYFVRHGRYTAGTATHYRPGLLTGGSMHQHLATGLVIGTRFHSAPVVRIGDGKVMQLGETLTADGRWRLIAFAPDGDDAGAGSPVRELCVWLCDAPNSPLNFGVRDGQDIDAVIDVRAVFRQSHHDLAVTDLPPLLYPTKGRLGLRDYEKAFCALPDATQNIYKMRGIDRARGCIMVVRPDQYIANVLPLNATDELAEFFAEFILR